VRAHAIGHRNEEAAHSRNDHFMVLDLESSNHLRRARRILKVKIMPNETQRPDVGTQYKLTPRFPSEEAIEHALSSAHSGLPRGASTFTTRLGRFPCSQEVQTALEWR
jgi:hypothetical protein